MANLGHGRRRKMRRDHVMLVRNAVINDDWPEVLSNLHTHNLSPNDCPYYTYNSGESEGAVGLLDTDGLQIPKESEQQLDALNTNKPGRTPCCSVLHFAICVNSPHVVKNCLELTKLAGLDKVHWSGRNCWQLAEEKGHGLPELIWGLATKTYENSPLEQHKHVAMADFKQILLDERRKQALRQNLCLHVGIFFCLYFLRYFTMGFVWSEFEMNVLAEKLVVTPAFERPSKRVFETCICEYEDLCEINKIKCPGAGQCLEEGKCNGRTGRCSYEPKKDGTACNDFNPLTINDLCTAGKCAGVNLCENVVCHKRACQDPGYKNQFQCDRFSGVCLYKWMAEGSKCEYVHNGDTITGTCQNVGTDQQMSLLCTPDDAGLPKEDLCAPVDCKPLNQCQESSRCEPKTGVCQYVPKKDGTNCTDGNADTVGDFCQKSKCVPGKCTQQQCPKADQCHNGTGTCDAKTGRCAFLPAPLHTPCDDKNPSTEDDKCNEDHVCAGKSKDPPCKTSSCKEQLQLCERDKSRCVSETQSCQKYGARCDYAGVIEIGECLDVGGDGQLTCELTNNCTADGNLCDDGNEATTNDHCKDHVCVGTDRCAGVICQPRTQCFLPGVCNPFTGLCEYAHKKDGTVCNDKNQDNGEDDKCESGICGTESPCEGFKCPGPADTCKTLTCQPTTGACESSNKPEGTFCSDNNPKTRSDVCDADGRCAGVNPCKSFKCPDIFCKECAAGQKCQRCEPTLVTVTKGLSAEQQWIAKCVFTCKQPRDQKTCAIERAEPCVKQASLIFNEETKQCDKQLKASNDHCSEKKYGDTWSGTCNGKDCEHVGDLLCKKWVCAKYGDCYKDPTCDPKKVDATTLVNKGVFSQEDIEKYGIMFDRNGDREFDASELTAMFEHAFVNEATIKLSAQTTQSPSGVLIRTRDGRTVSPSLPLDYFKKFAGHYFNALGKTPEELDKTLVRADKNENLHISLREFQLAIEEVVAFLALECSVPQPHSTEQTCTPQKRIPNVDQYRCNEGKCVAQKTKTTKSPLRFLEIRTKPQYFAWLQQVMLNFYETTRKNGWKLPDGHTTLLYNMYIRWKQARPGLICNFPSLKVDSIKEIQEEKSCYPELTNAVLEADGGDVLIEIKPIEVGAVGAEADKASGGDVFKPIEVVAEADKASNRDAFKPIESRPPISGHISTYLGSGFVEHFDKWDPEDYSTLIERIKSAVEEPSTRAIFTGFALYNNQARTVCKVVLTLEFSASGAGFASYTAATGTALTVDDPGSQVKLVGGFTCLGVLLVLCICYASRIAEMVRIHIQDIPTFTTYKSSATHQIYRLSLVFDFMNFVCLVVTLGFMVYTTGYNLHLEFKKNCYDAQKYVEVGLMIFNGELRGMIFSVSFLVASIVFTQSFLRSCGCLPLWTSLIMSAHQMIPILFALAIFTLGLMLNGECLFGSQIADYTTLGRSFYTVTKFLFGFPGGDEGHVGRIEADTPSIGFRAIIFICVILIFETAILAITVDTYKAHLQGRSIGMRQDCVNEVARRFGCRRVPVDESGNEIDDADVDTDDAKKKWVCKRNPEPNARLWISDLSTWGLIGGNGKRSFLSREDLTDIYSGPSPERKIALMWEFLGESGMLLTHDQRRARTDVSRELQKIEESEATAGNFQQEINLQDLEKLQKTQRDFDKLYMSQWTTDLIFRRELQASQERYIAAKQKLEAITKKLPPAEDMIAHS